jgi:hypothetical protein
MEGGAAHRNWATPVAPLAGEGVERTRGLPTVDLWPQMGGGAPVVGRPAAHREHGRCELCSGGPPVWEEARAAPVCCRV